MDHKQCLNKTLRLTRTCT